MCFLNNSVAQEPPLCVCSDGICSSSFQPLCVGSQALSLPHRFVYIDRRDVIRHIEYWWNVDLYGMCMMFDTFWHNLLFKLFQTCQYQFLLEPMLRTFPIRWECETWWFATSLSPIQFLHSWSVLVGPFCCRLWLGFYILSYSGWIIETKVLKDVERWKVLLDKDRYGFTFFFVLCFCLEPCFNVWSLYVFVSIQYLNIRIILYLYTVFIKSHLRRTPNFNEGYFWRNSLDTLT